MRIPNIPADTYTDPAGLPIFFDGGRTAVLLIHGYTGITDELRYLGQRLRDAGYTVSIPRLPGHGTRGEDFLETTWKDWLRKTYDEYFDLKGRFDRVYLAGLSMGALLVLLAAARFNPEKIVLAAPAITNTDRLIVLTPLMRFFFKTLPKNGYSFSGPPEYVHISEEYWTRKWVAPAADLLRLQSFARKNLSEVKSDTLIIVSEKDTTIPLRAADIVERGIASKKIHRITLKESGHVVFNDSERERVAEEVITWFKG
jgi:carboxylesterase